MNEHDVRTRLEGAGRLRARCSAGWRLKPVADEEGHSFWLATLVPLVLILMTITGAVYPAIDLTAGERERGTLEALMAAPVPRLGLLLAKYIAVVTVAMLTAVVNLTAMTITLASAGLWSTFFGDAGLSVASILAVLVLLVLFAAFFSAVLLCDHQLRPQLQGGPGVCDSADAGLPRSRLSERDAGPGAEFAPQRHAAGEYRAAGPRRAGRPTRRRCGAPSPCSRRPLRRRRAGAGRPHLRQRRDPLRQPGKLERPVPPAARSGDSRRRSPARDGLAIVAPLFIIASGVLALLHGVATSAQLMAPPA